jgi:hypothetical protein
VFRNGKPFFKQSFGEILGSMKTMMAQVHSKADLFSRVGWQPPYSNGRVPAYQTSQQLLREQYIESLIVDGQHQPLLPHASSPDTPPPLPHATPTPHQQQEGA